MSWLCLVGQADETKSGLCSLIGVDGDAHYKVYKVTNYARLVWSCLANPPDFPRRVCLYSVEFRNELDLPMSESPESNIHEPQITASSMTATNGHYFGTRD
jgi:hypothetical protein